MPWHAMTVRNSMRFNFEDPTRMPFTGNHIYFLPSRLLVPGKCPIRPWYNLSSNPISPTLLRSNANYHSWKKHIGPASTIILAWTLIARRRLESHKCCWAAWIAIPTTESSDHTELLWDQFSCFIWATRFVDGKSARRCGAKHLLKSKCAKHRTTFGGAEVASLQLHLQVKVHNNTTRHVLLHQR